MKAKKCKHENISDWTTRGMHNLEEVEHLYCNRCGWHKFRGVEYTEQEWFEWVNEGKLEGGK